VALSSHFSLVTSLCRNYRILSGIVRTFFKEIDAEIFPAHYTWKAAERVLKIKLVMWCFEKDQLFETKVNNFMQRMGLLK
jgi:hypothetical protein